MLLQNKTNLGFLALRSSEIEQYPRKMNNAHPVSNHSSEHIIFSFSFYFQPPVITGTQTGPTLLGVDSDLCEMYIYWAKFISQELESCCQTDSLKVLRGVQLEQTIRL